MRRHIIYIPGLGDRYDGIRRLGLRFWRRPGLRVTHIPMRWADPVETYDQKLIRIRNAVATYDDHEVTLVGESAGGAMALAAMRQHGDTLSRVVTLCGMNQGAANVNPKLYAQHRAFHDTMLAADAVVATMTTSEKTRLLTVYSSSDFTVRPRNTLIKGVASYDLRIPGHMVAILAVLFWRHGHITNKTTRS